MIDYILTRKANGGKTIHRIADVTGAVIIRSSDIITDTTTELQILFDLYAGMHIKLSGTFSNIGRLFVRTNTTLELLSNCTCSPRALTTAEQTQENQDVTNGGPDYRWAMFYLESGARLRGAGKINGLKSARPYAHGIAILNTTARCKVAGIDITNTGGDAVLMANAYRPHIERLSIYNCTGRGIHGVITAKARIQNNEIDGVQHGIQWWGDLTNGICTGWSITGNVISNCTNQTVNGQTVAGGGGIWGKLGSMITITGNTIDTCDDVGIDFELSYDSTATGNTVRNCKNAALSTFYASERITFANNIITQGTGMGNGYKAFGTGISKDITLKGGSITIDSGADGIFTDAGVCESLTIDGVTVICNGGIPVLSQDSHRTTIINCPKLQTTGGFGIDVRGGSNGLVFNNRLIYTGTDSGNARGIRLYWRSSGYPCQFNRVTDNVLINFGAGIFDDNNGNATSYNVFENNVTPSVTVNVNSGWQGRRRGNRTSANAICDGSQTNTLADTFAPTTGGRVFWDGTGYDTTVETITGITLGSGVVYAPVLTLPVSTGGTYDHAVLQVSMGGWGGSVKKLYTVSVGQRDGFAINVTCQGDNSVMGTLVAYTNSGITTLYILTNSFAEVGVRYLKLNLSTPVTALNWSGTAPAGTLAYSSASTPPNLEVTPSDVLAFGSSIVLKTGTSVQSGNGSLTSFTITHGLGQNPAYVSIQAGSTAADGSLIRFITANTTTITITYKTAPTSGTNNLTWYWAVKK